MRVALQLDFPAEEVADYFFRPEVVSHWIGRGCKLAPLLGIEVMLPHATTSDPMQSAIRYDKDKEKGEVIGLLWPAADGAAIPKGIYELVAVMNAPNSTRVAIRISPRPDGTCRLRIEHSGLSTEEHRKVSLQVWQAALGRVNSLMVQAIRSYHHEHQAVILVHGIGEQKPGQFLREFVKNVFGKEHFYVKPDRLSPLFEMRMVRVPGDKVNKHKDNGDKVHKDKMPTTDVYELYWAHLVRDTTLVQVCRWAWRLAMTRGAKIPKELRSLVWLIIVSVLALVTVAWVMDTYKHVFGWLTGLGFVMLVVRIAFFAFKALRDEFIIGYLGDAARYLDPRADNISSRQKIREAGAQLLDELHKDDRYTRIIVYAHSLGSVIAYDVLSYTWGSHSRDCKARPRMSSRKIAELEGLLNPRSRQSSAQHSLPLSIEEIQAKQHAAWKEYRRNGFKWLVTDFVTAGSPLTHAAWLLNLDAKTSFKVLKDERTMPTCPPQTEERQGKPTFTFTHPYEDPYDPTKKRSVLVPHHGGLFALTRWTNLYFPSKCLFGGDPVGGPVANVDGEACFGNWVKDVPLNQKSKGFVHTLYTDPLEADAVDQVRIALNLPYTRLNDHAPYDLPSTVLK